MKLKILLRPALLAVMVCCVGCATLGESGGFLTNINLLSTSEEVQLGQRFAVEVEKQEPVHPDAELQAYVREIGARLAGVSPRQDVAHTFTVIDAPDTVNAFALPGGYTYYYTGLMKICESEAELAAVMAHELAHVAARHHGEMITRQMGMEAISSIILGENPGAAAGIVSQLFSSGVAARFSRMQEREADQLGMDILYRAGYQPEAMITFMQKLLEYDRQRGGGQHSLPIFATHPSPEERVQLLQTIIQRYPVEMRRQRQIGAERYQAQALAKVQ
ncbi:MAG TPA: peptidase M48 [Candidatus Hydrogenedentes bacterium]|nr:peptidase M48 [Candidatus Hydrogenedentota bacterium]